jgi:DNA-binding MarR family transcriptional regulator
VSRTKLDMPPYQHSYVQKLTRLASKVEKTADSVLSTAHNLTFSQYQVLATLRQHPLFSQTQIAEQIGVTPAVVTRQVMVLADRGLLTQVRSQINRRLNILTLTVSGEKLCLEAEERLNSEFRRLLTSLRGGDEALFERCLVVLDEELAA